MIQIIVMTLSFLSKMGILDQLCDSQLLNEGRCNIAVL